MKKTVIISSLCFIIALFFVLAGCSPSNGGDSSAKDSENAAEEVSNVFDNGYYILGDWENYEQAVQLLQNASFGKVIQSSEYVTRGKQSLRLEVFGYQYFWGDAAPGLTIRTDNAYFQKQDFSDCDMFAFDMYSVMDYDLTVRFSVTPLSGVAVTKKITVKPGWNYVTVSRKDLGARWQNQIKSFSFGFDRGAEHEETQTVYIDNFRARKIAD